jgi:hypothetical protein
MTRPLLKPAVVEKLIEAERGRIKTLDERIGQLMAKRAEAEAVLADLYLLRGAAKQ